MIGCAVKIGDFATRFFDEDESCGDVPAFQAKFPEAIEAACGDTGEVEGGGAIAADTVGAKREVVVVVNVGAGLAFVNGKAGAKKAGSERRNFGNGDFISVQSGAIATGSSEEFFVNGIVDDAGDDLVAVRERDRDAETGIAVREIRGPVEWVDMPAIFGVVITAETFFCGDGVGGEIFGEAIDDGLFAAFVGLRDEIDVTLVFYFRRAGKLFAKNFSGFESGFDGDFEKTFCVIGQSGLQRKSVKR